MRSRAEKSKDFETIKSTLFEAGISVVKAAKAHEDMFNTSLEAIADAMEIDLEDEHISNRVLDSSQVNSICEALLLQRQEAEIKGDFDSYVVAEEKLQQIEEFQAQRLERQARILEAQIRIQSAQKQLSNGDQESGMSESGQWTEQTLKNKYKTLKNLQNSLGVIAKTWKSAVDQVNQLRN